MMRVTVDYSEESHHDSLIRNNLLQMCLSTLNHLGWNGEYKPRTFRSKMSMFALNLRNIMILITIAHSVPGHMKERTPLDEPGEPLSLCFLFLLPRCGSSADLS
jgi:mediator of RNA polymerase II transcription subunit 16